MTKSTILAVAVIMLTSCYTKPSGFSKGTITSVSSNKFLDMGTGLLEVDVVVDTTEGGVSELTARLTYSCDTCQVLEGSPVDIVIYEDSKPYAYLRK